MVIENRAIKSMILSTKSNLSEELTEIVNKNPNRKTEKVVKIALSLNNEP